jgi:hypothetical protein
MKEHVCPFRAARARRQWAAAASLSLLLAAATWAAPPGFNIHLVAERPEGRFWRGGAPRRDTVEALARSARARGVDLTLVDLRHPMTADDRRESQGRLSPDSEQAMARQLGVRYLSISALDHCLCDQLREAAERGDVYMHCMYGVNRTGFALARFARASRLAVSRAGLGTRDWAQGESFQARLNRLH